MSLPVSMPTSRSWSRSVSCALRGRSMLRALRVCPRGGSLLVGGWLRCFLARATFVSPKPAGVRSRGCLGEAGLSLRSWGGLGRFGVRAGVRMGLGVLASPEEDEESSLWDWKRLLSSSEEQSSSLALCASSPPSLQPPGVPSEDARKPGRSARSMSSSNRELLSSEAVK